MTEKQHVLVGLAARLPPKALSFLPARRSFRLLVFSDHNEPAGAALLLVHPQQSRLLVPLLLSFTDDPRTDDARTMNPPLLLLLVVSPSSRS